MVLSRPFRHADDDRRERVTTLVRQVTDALKIASLRTDQGFTVEKFEESLQSELECAANNAISIFGQPWDWEYEWVAEEPGFPVVPEVRFMNGDSVRLLAPGLVSFKQQLKNQRRRMDQEEAAAAAAAERVAPESNAAEPSV